MRIFPAILIILCLAAVQAPAQVIIPRTADSGRPQIDIESYRIEATIDPYEGELLAEASIRFIQLDRQNYAVLDLDRRLRVRDVYLGEEEPVAVRFRQYDIDSTLEVDLSDLGQFDEPFIRVVYDGVLDPEEGRREPILARIGAENAFLLREAKWFPQNGENDPALMEMRLTVPAEWEVVSGLAERGSEPSALGPGSRVVALLSDSPSLGGTVAAGAYRSTGPGAGAVDILVFEESAVGAEEMGGFASEVFGYFSETFGAPDAAGLRMVEIDGANWEARSVSGMLLLPSSEFSEDFDRFDLARHVATQWFPLTYGIEDPVADAWLADGLAVFASLHYFEGALSRADAHEYVERALVRALSYEGDVTVGRAGSLPGDSADYRVLAGSKGGFIFRMLRDAMGEEAFRSMLASLPQTFGSVPLSTGALYDAASASAGEDLTYFFDQWLNSPGIPEFTREYTVFRTSSGYKIMGQIKQDLDLFRMPVELEVETDGEPEYHTVEVSGPNSDFDIVTERKPRRVVIDPNMRLLRLSPDIRVAVHIARGEDLADAGRLNEAIDEYQDAVDLDRFSSLALFRMGEALFELGNLQAAAQTFRDALNGDLTPVWVEVWAYINLGKIYDIRGDRERAVNEYQKAVNTRDDAYGAQEEAERYINAPFRRAGRTIA